MNAQVDADTSGPVDVTFFSRSFCIRPSWSVRVHERVFAGWLQGGVLLARSCSIL